MFKNFFLLILLFNFVSGCAYTTKSMVPADAKSIFIPIFKNNTYRPSKTDKTFKRDIENIITDSVLKAFLKDGSLKIVNKDKADLMLEGIVTYFSKAPLRYSRVDMDIVSEYRVCINVELQLKDLKTGNILWDKKTITRENDYYVEGSAIGTEDSALVQIAEEIAKDILISVVEAW